MTETLFLNHILKENILLIESTLQPNDRICYINLRVTIIGSIS